MLATELNKVSTIKLHCLSFSLYFIQPLNFQNRFVGTAPTALFPLPSFVHRLHHFNKFPAHVSPAPRMCHGKLRQCLIADIPVRLYIALVPGEVFLKYFFRRSRRSIVKNHYRSATPVRRSSSSEYPHV